MLAAGFHESIGRAAADAAIGLATSTASATVALSGGVFQNPRLSEVVGAASDGRRPRGARSHRIVPPNDGGISIGQAAVAAARQAPG